MTGRKRHLNVENPALSMETFPSPPRRWTKRYDVVQAILDHRFDNGPQLSERIGAPYDSVRLIASQYGLKVGPAKFSAIGTENQIWLRDAAARAGIAPGQLLDAIVTDARLDEDEGCSKGA